LTILVRYFKKSLFDVGNSNTSNPLDNNFKMEIPKVTGEVAAAAEEEEKE
jgi:hypothetical protein